jgi:NAD(P)-dependent dehydrogenase (short-subunit alcohol dehydrogenase family)
MPILKDKVAIVTGGGQGVGRGIALALAREGAAVAVAGRTEASLADTCAAIEALGGKAMKIVCDVTRAADISAAVEQVVARFGGIDILVNNAQQIVNCRILDADDAMFQDSFSSGPLAVFRFMKACHPHMKRRGGGSVINLATGAAVAWDMAGLGFYSAVKEAIRSFSHAASCEWGRDGIRVNVIAPLAMSPGLAEWMKLDPAAGKAFVDKIPVGRLGDPEADIGRTVVFLVGPDSGYVTGATIPVDGGNANWR